jgi:hypothetical protein
MKDLNNLLLLGMLRPAFHACASFKSQVSMAIEFDIEGDIPARRVRRLPAFNPSAIPALAEAYGCRTEGLPTLSGLGASKRKASLRL